MGSPKLDEEALKYVEQRAMDAGDEDVLALVARVRKLEVRCKKLKRRGHKALEVLSGGQVAGEHHKLWVIDQAVRALAGPGYREWVAEYEDGEEGPHTYEWETGTAP